MIVFPVRESGRTLLMHGSPALGFAVGIGVNVTSKVGKGVDVTKISNVFVGTTVGEGNVAVGMAAWVSASSVKATATAVLCRSTGLAVGVAFAPHALIISVITSACTRIEKRFMWTSPNCAKVPW